MGEFERWIDAHKGHGELRDQGEFTLRSDEAIRKIARFGLDSPERGLLRISQLALDRGAESLSFRLKRSSVEILISCSKNADFELGELGLERQLDANSLALALLSCLYSGFQEGTIRGDGLFWRFDRSGFALQDPEKCESGKIVVVLERTKAEGFWPQLGEFLRRRCVDYLTLREHLSCSPIPVLLDGFQLNSQELRPAGGCLCELLLFGPSSLRVGATRKMSTQTAGLSLGFKTTYKVARKQANLKYFSGHAEDEKGQSNVVLAHLWFPRDRKLAGQIAFVYQGVVIDRVETKLKLPLCGVVSAHGLDRDLSNLKLVRNKELAALWNYLKAQMNELMRAISLQPMPDDVAELLEVGGYLGNDLDSEVLPKSAGGPQAAATWGTAYRFDFK